jgi:hypothetical protein
MSETAEYQQLTLPSTVDAEIKRRIDAVWASHSYVTDDGERDAKKMHEAAFQAVRNRIATSKTDKQEKAITKGELYAAVFPHGPGADGNGDPVDEYDRAVFHALERDVWSLTQAKHSGAIQHRLGEEGSSLILCHATIRRNLDKAQAIYLTDNGVLIMEDSVDKEIKALERKAENLRRQLEMVIDRHPELASRIRAEVGQGVKRAQAELAFPTLNGHKELAEQSS